MLGCECQQGHGHGGQDEALRMLPQQLQGAGNDSLMFYIQGVRTGLAIRAAEQAKWQRVGITLAVAFGAIAFLSHFGDKQ